MPKGVYDRVGDYLAYPGEAYDYGRWIAHRAPWQLFCTLTIKDLERYVVGQAGAERFLRTWFRNSVRSRGFMGGTKPYGLFAIEPHQNRVAPHFHGLLGGLPRWLVLDVVAGLAGDRPRGYLWYEWYRDHGRAKIVPCADTIGTAVYVSKYVTKTAGKIYAFGVWPQVSEYDDARSGEENYDEWALMPGSGNAERMWREMCESL
jgi:hypothetical protein